MMGTPDNRPGWSTFFLANGYAVYVVDQTGRGKSAYHADIYGPTTRGNATGLQQRFTAVQLYNLWPQAHLHTQWPGSGLMGDLSFDQFYALRRAGDGVRGNAAVHDARGGGGAARPDRSRNRPDPLPVRPVRMAHRRRASDAGQGTPAGGAERAAVLRRRAAGRADLVRRRQPEQALGHHLGPHHLLPGGLRASYDHCTSKYLTQAGVEHTFVRLESVGVRGNGHMMMLEKNNLDISAFMAQWLRENVDGKAKGEKGEKGRKGD